MFEHRLRVTDQMLAVQDWRLDILQQLLERLLPLDLRRTAEIVSIQIQEIEGIENEPILIAPCKFGLEFRKVRSPIVDDSRLPVDDRLAGEIERAGNQRKPLRPVQPVAGVDPPPSLVQVDLNPVTVVINLVQPIPLRRSGFEGRQLGLNESRHFRRLGA
jgi:hypothetical protein